jgi:hypothetical protein
VKAVRTIVVVVLIVAALLGGLYYADGRIRERVEQQVMTDLQTELGTPAAPSVDIAGVPFLTQVVAGRIGSVHVLADDLGTTNEAPLAVSHVDLVLTDVTSDDRFQTMTARHAEGVARLDYSALQSLAGVPLTYIGDGRVRTEVTTEVFGQQVKARIDGSPALDVRAQAITLDDAKIEVAGVNLPDFTSKALLRAVLKPIPLAGIPFGLQVTSVDARDDGVYADLRGDDLPIR